MLMLLCVQHISAQCTPNAQYADSTFGVWPDTITNFPPATVNVPYSTDLNFKVPLNASDVVAGISGTIQSFTVDTVSGLPPGMNYACNISSCSYAGGANGCAQISGTSSVPGTYDITISITGQVNIGFGVIVPIPQDFGGYRIIVNDAQGGLEQLNTYVLLQPNPTKDKFMLNGIQPGTNVRVTDLSGKQIASTCATHSETEIDLSNAANGLYLVHLHDATGIQLFKVIKE